ncbi:IucA/IucC family protein [Nitrosococcus oceani]|uniref:IucA/IucC family protein n=1 Tax=Nitrosococcus oceani TaxID=1229 RepID=UPI0004E8B9B8|nr:IucA/IucC family protein [Nitrosococcus oceani]KFI22473.1 short-chain oxidoreductase [Nitrosococcus oceani]
MKENNELNKLAEKHSVTALINSFLRECSDFEIENNEIIFKNNEQTLSIVLENYSRVGNHSYLNIFYEILGNKKKFLNFEDFIREFLRWVNKNDEMPGLYQRIMESHNNIAQILDYRKQDYKKLFKKNSLSFIEAEQALLLGHNFHPCPKSKEQFSQEDHHLYAPEFKGNFNLKWAFLNKEHLIQKNSEYFNNIDWYADLFKQDHETVIKDGYIPFPFHPWQFKSLSNHKEIKELIKDKDLIPIEKEGRLKWKATSSLRTIYCENSHYMLKFSLSLRITNSIRHLQEVEIVRGIQVHDVINSSNGKDFLNKNKNFHILCEPSFLAIKGKSSNLIIETIVLIRANPFRGQMCSEAIVLSTIAQADPYLEKGFFSSRNIDAKKWFYLYLNYVLDPFIMAQANHGILFGAHQQNIIVQLNDKSYPFGVIFRDCQGTGYTSLGYEKMRQEVPLLDLDNGNILDRKMAHILLGYYLIINSTFSLINALAIQKKCNEEDLLHMLVEYLLDKKNSDILDKSFLDYLLDSDLIGQKGNFFCCLKGINENTEKNPLDIYNFIQNPLSSKF